MKIQKSVVIKVTKEIFVRSRKTLSDLLLKEAKANIKRIGIDLSDIDYLDSEGVGLIAYNYVVLHELERELYLVNPSDRVTVILQRTGLVKIIGVERNVK